MSGVGCEHHKTQREDAYTLRNVMTTKPLKRLSDLEIDEVSLVDRPANQHGLVTITKRDEGSRMAVYDAQGNEVDESQLQSGDIVYAEDGTEIQMFSDDDLQALLESGQVDPNELELVDFAEADGGTPYGVEDARELASVGKSAGGASAVGNNVFQAGRKLATRTFNEARAGYAHGRHGRVPSGATDDLGRDARRFGAHVGRNKNAYIVGASAGTAGNVHGRVRKSLGESVLSDLSKALTDGDRDQVISKMANQLEDAQMTAQQAISKAEELAAQAEFGQYVEIAKSFELPVDPEDLGGILQEVSKVLSDEQLDVLERILHTAAAAIEYEELGSAGGSPLMAYVGSEARELVGKSAGEISEAEATTALFSANDDAYLAYLSENQR